MNDFFHEFNVEYVLDEPEKKLETNTIASIKQQLTLQQLNIKKQAVAAKQRGDLSVAKELLLKAKLLDAKIDQIKADDDESVPLGVRVAPLADPKRKRVFFVSNFNSKIFQRTN